MKKWTIICLAAFFAAGCASQPGVIEDALLIEKTPEQAQKLELLENQTIEKNREVIAATSEYNEAKKESVKQSGNMSVTEKERVVVEEKVKMAKSLSDDAALSEAQEALRKIDAKILSQTLLYNYAFETAEYKKTIKEVKEAELNVLVAELNYEKAKIAKAYQIKKQAENPDKNESKKEKSFFDMFTKDSSGIIDDTQYSKYVTKQKDAYNSRLEDRDFQEEKYNQAKSNYEKNKALEK